MLPTAAGVVAYVLRAATTVVTASAGGENDFPPAMAAEIWRYFTKPSVAMTANTIASIWSMRLFTTGNSWGRRRGRLVTDRDSKFAVRCGPSGGGSQVSSRGQRIMRRARAV